MAEKYDGAEFLIRLIRNQKSKIKMAERTGVEPAYPYGRRFSRPLHYHYAISPQA